MSGELLYESGHTRVSRERVDGGSGTVIRKRRLGPGAAQRIRHELAMLERLAGVPGVPRLVPAGGATDALVVADEGGETVGTRLAAGPLDVAEVLRFAEELATVVAAVHRRGIVHKDINPANVLVYGDPPRPALIDFDLASTLAEERPGFTHHREIVGTLAYIAPEQTGRTGWPVDQRADLYAIGATLYEMAIGRPPFAQDDPLRLVHDHLSRVPVAACEVDPRVPAELAAVIAYLLEKEPDRRYQSAEGLLHDLRRLRAAGGAPVPGFRPGERDFPWRLAVPSRLVGRDAEVEVLRAALADAVAGRARGLLVSGAPGVGKTALIDELRPLVTAAGGWFVRGKAEQFRQGDGSDALRQVLRGVGRLLLAEPEERLAPLRSRLIEALGPNAPLLATGLPEFRALLGGQAAAGAEPVQQTEGDLHRRNLDMLRVVATPEHPLVILIDDLQWAGALPLGFVDALISDEHLAGVLLVGAYRESEVDQTHGLSALLSRWRQSDRAPAELRLGNLPAADLGTMIAEMLRQPATDAAVLARAVCERTEGNPFDTVEFLNTLRRDGALHPGDDGWSWDAAAVDRYAGRGDVVGMLTARIGGLAASTRDLLEIMACLGGEVELDLLRAAVPPAGEDGEPEADLEGLLAPALEDGLLVMEHGAAASVRFRHDRIQQAAYGGMTAARRTGRGLALARRLSADARYDGVAAQQYLPVAGEVTDPAERRTVAELFRTAARRATLVTNHADAERFLARAGDLLDAAGLSDSSQAVDVAIERHAALCAVGRVEDADRVYARVERDCTDPVRRADAASVQIRSLAGRRESRRAVDVGLAMLAELGHPAPRATDIATECVRGADALREWVGVGSEEEDLRRGVNTDARLAAVAKIINWMIPASYFIGSPIMPWLVTEAARVWQEGGPAAALVRPLMRAPFITIPGRADYRTGYEVARRALRVAVALGVDDPSGHHLYALGAAPWFEPLEDGLRQARRACEDSLRAGHVVEASFAYWNTCHLPEYARALDELAEEVETALAVTRRAGNGQVTAILLPYRQAVRALRGETDRPGTFTDASFDEQAHLESLAGNASAAGNFHTMRALTAAIFGDTAALSYHAAAAIPLMYAFAATQVAVRAHVLRALAVAVEAHASPPAQRAGALAEFDRHRDWMAARAIEAPGNFLHLSMFMDAERAWLAGDFDAANRGFDAAQREAVSRQRPWQRALIADRHAAFYLAQGMEYAARAALHEARRRYDEWGATAKVRQLDEAYPFLRAVTGRQPVASARSTSDTRRSSTISSDMIDMMAVLRASQALSSETNLVRLQQRVVEVVGALTGATGVRLLLWDADAARWVLPDGDGAGPVGAPDQRLPVEDAAAAGLLPISAFRYVQRTHEPLLVEDVTRDDRFAHDPYLAGLDECSLLVVPILSRGEPTAMLLLENRLGRSAFGTDRLDVVQLIAGPLAVSLDNAVLYAALERKVAERTEALTAANEQLELLAVTDPLTGLPNRRRLAETLDLEWRRSIRPGTPLTIAMIDIDQFKQYNDHYGHPAGDECLRAVAATIARTVRDTDLVARYGGEEFAMVLPGADQKAAGVTAERVRRAVAALAKPHEHASHGVVTVSIGFASVVPSPTDTPEQVLKVADSQLYRAKQAGRNRVACAADPEGTGPLRH